MKLVSIITYMLNWTNTVLCPKMHSRWPVSRISHTWFRKKNFNGIRACINNNTMFCMSHDKPLYQQAREMHGSLIVVKNRRNWHLNLFLSKTTTEVSSWTGNRVYWIAYVHGHTCSVLCTVLHFSMLPPTSPTSKKKKTKHTSNTSQN